MEDYRGRVLVVDDDYVALTITRARLEEAGFEVITRAEAFGTSQAIYELKPDVILLDINMPLISGEMIASTLKESINPEDAKTSIIFHSSQDLITLQETVRKTGVLGAISKTGNDDHFIAQFERLFTRHQKVQGKK